MPKKMPNEFGLQLNAILANFSSQVDETVDAETRQIAKEAAKKLRQTSPKKARGKNSGKYAKGWTWKQANDKKRHYRVIVWNATDWQLTHLLEYGHRVVKNGKATEERTEPQPHIADVEKWVQEELPRRIKEKLNGG